MTILYPKRTRTKLANKQKIIRVAINLFARKGYQASTQEEIAQDANLHLQTIYRHFRSKEELAIAAAELSVSDCNERFKNNFSQSNTFEIWRKWIKSSSSFLLSLGIGEEKRDRLCSASSLMNDNYLLIIYSGYEDLLTHYIAQDFCMDVKIDRLPRLVAGMLWNGNEAAMKRCAGKDTESNNLHNVNHVLAESLAVVDDIEAVFKGHIKLQRRSHELFSDTNSSSQFGPIGEC